MKRLLLEDDEFRTIESIAKYTQKEFYLQHPWTIVRTFDQFKEYILTQGLPDIISFDHDLYITDKTESTGRDCAKWLLEYCLTNNMIPPKVYIHSMNTVGAKNIKSLFTTFFKVYPELDNHHPINDVEYNFDLDFFIYT